MKYTKPCTTCEEQIQLLKSRGLVVTDEKRALKYLNTVGYYRLTGYMYHLQTNDGSHQFKDGTTFDEVIDTYTFDKKLRYLTASYLERIEVAMRIMLTNVYSITHGFYWYTDTSQYTRLTPPDDIKERVNNGEIQLPRKYHDTHALILADVRENFMQSTETFIKKFQTKYTAEQFPPSNMAMEILSMGKIARLYDALKNSTQKQEVASGFGIPHLYLSTWFIYLTNIRNICAHHGRLWNRRTTADRFKVPDRKEFRFSGNVDENFNTYYYGTLSVMIRLLNVINPEHSLEKKFRELVAEYPKINLAYMGFPGDWEKNPAWA